VNGKKTNYRVLEPSEKREVKETELRLLPKNLLASPELASARQAICAVCANNQNGRCLGCCGGVPVVNKIRLFASRCPHFKWAA
jgi:hypothetical protein